MLADLWVAVIEAIANYLLAVLAILQGNLPTSA